MTKLAKSREAILKKFSTDMLPSYEGDTCWINTAKEKGYTEFDPVEEIMSVLTGGYEWFAVRVFKNANGTYALVWGGGCSCHGEETCDVEIFKDLEQVADKIRAEAETEKKSTYYEYDEEQTWTKAFEQISSKRKG
jgi:hypothetical protein